MTKSEILERFALINNAYNNTNTHDDLSDMIDKLLEDHTQKIIEALENDKIDMSLPDVTGTFTRDREVYNKCCDNHIEMIRNFDAFSEE